MNQRANQKARSRARVLEAARLRFAAKGFDAFTFRDLAADIEVSTGMIFSHFADKAALFEAAMGVKPDAALAFVRTVADWPAGDATAAHLGVIKLRAEARRILDALAGAGQAETAADRRRSA